MLAVRREYRRPEEGGRGSHRNATELVEVVKSDWGFECWKHSLCSGRTARSVTKTGRWVVSHEGTNRLARVTSGVAISNMRGAGRSGPALDRGFCGDLSFPSFSKLSKLSLVVWERIPIWLLVATARRVFLGTIPVWARRQSHTPHAGQRIFPP